MTIRVDLCWNVEGLVPETLMCHRYQTKNPGSYLLVHILDTKPSPKYEGLRPLKMVLPVILALLEDPFQTLLIRVEPLLG